MFDKQVTFTVGLVTQFGDEIRPDFVTDTVAILFDKHFVDGFTVTEHRGYWKGVSEASISYSVVCSTGSSVHRNSASISGALALALNQEAVLCVIQDVEARFCMALEDAPLFNNTGRVY